MTRSATFVIALASINVGVEVGRLWPNGFVGNSSGSYEWLVITLAWLGLCIAYGVAESRKSGWSA